MDTNAALFDSRNPNHGRTGGLYDPEPLLNEYMTGRHRLRKTPRSMYNDGRPFVLQLEISVWDQKQHRWVCKYRDATFTDIQNRGEIIVEHDE